MKQIKKMNNLYKKHERRPKNDIYESEYENRKGYTT